MALLFGGCHLNVSLLPSSGPIKENVISGEGTNKILIVPIKGFISMSGQADWSGAVSPSVVESVSLQLERAKLDNDIKAIVLMIDSPGGVVTACDVIHREILKFKKKRGVKIIALQMSIAASGGYYISTAADKIIAHPTTVTGSIGVIMVKLSAQGLMEKIGILDETVKAGKSKAATSPFKDMTPQERLHLQNLINSMHERFKKVILNSRSIVIDHETTFDGRVFIANDAKKRNLIDKVGYMDDAVAVAKELAGINKAKVISYSRNKEKITSPYSISGKPAQLERTSADSTNLTKALSHLTDKSSSAFLYYWSP
jgi:protease-4